MKDEGAETATRRRETRRRLIDTLLSTKYISGRRITASPYLRFPVSSSPFILPTALNPTSRLHQLSPPRSGGKSAGRVYKLPVPFPYPLASLPVLHREA